MKVLYNIPDGDYEASIIQQKYSGKKVADVIANSVIDGMLDITNDSNEEYRLEVRIVEVGDKPSAELLDLIRNEICDYDMLKHQNFWFEDEVFNG